VQTLTASDFEGCGPRVNIDFMIKYTELCLLISKVLKERFGLRVSREQRRAALGSADEGLANWCLCLPPSLQMRSSDMDLWSATLHLSYNNFLILLHRPHPKAAKRTDDYGPNDGDICSAAANTVATIFEDLREKDRIKYLWISDVNALFTAMIQVSVELRFSNPVLAINALRRFDSTLNSLRKLAEYWINAESILRIFEESSEVQHVVRLGKGSKETQPTIRERSERGSGSRGEQRVRTLDQPGKDTNSDLVISNSDLVISNLQQTHNWAIERQSDLDVLAAAANAASDFSNGQVQQMQTRNDLENDWASFIASDNSGSNQIMLSPDIMQMDDEWREIYWQEPGIPGSFGDGMWGW
jgi:transcriptional regulatory protein AMDR